MTEQKQTSTKQKGTKSTARKLSYRSLLGKYPLYSMLLVLNDYEQLEEYEECAIIKEALDEHSQAIKDDNKALMAFIDFPTSLADYHSDSFQKILDKNNIVVNEESAKEKATLIKLKLPINNGLSNYKK